MPQHISSNSGDFNETITKVALPIFEGIQDIKLRNFLASEFGFIVTVLKNITTDSEALREIVNKDIVIHLGSIVETMLMHYLHVKINKDKSLRKKVCTEEEVVTIYKQDLSKTETLHFSRIQRREKKDFKIQSWYKANIIAKDYKLVSPTCFLELETMRKERNEIHLFSALSSGVSSKKLADYESLFIKTFKYLDRKIELL